MELDPKIPANLALLPPDVNFMREEYIGLLLQTRTELGELNGYSRSLPNPMLLLSPAVIKEAVASSNIENINTTMEDVLQAQLFPEVEQKPRDKEVLHYRDAIMWGFENLKEIPISTRLILGIQQRLIPGVDAAYRKTQNRIVNSQSGEIRYTPPLANEIPRLISNWEAFVNNDNDRIDPLVKAAITHYQFESIHPFGDGNGRTGRILIVLYLIQQKLLSLPILYISGFINRNRREYYDSLQRVRSEGTWQEWIIYMLRGLNEQALQTKSTLFETLDLLDRFRESIQKSHPKIYSSDLVEALFASPIITPVNLGKKLRVNYRTASRYLAELARGKLLQDSYVGKYHVYANRPLLKLLHG